jgi:hypothetical protein
MAVSAARAIPPFPRVLQPHLGRGRFGRGRAQAPKDWTAHRLVRSRQNRHPAPRTLEEPARFAVRWHVRPGSLMTGLRSRSPPTESPSPVLSLGDIFGRAERLSAPGALRARMIERSNSANTPSIWRSALPDGVIVR